MVVEKIVFTSKILEKMLLQAEIRRRKQKQNLQENIVSTWKVQENILNNIAYFYFLFSSEASSYN